MLLDFDVLEANIPKLWTDHKRIRVSASFAKFVLLANLAQRRFITVIVAGKHPDGIPLSSLSLSSSHINRIWLLLFPC
nr:hypothetical protein CFP56_09749 [Quercus suber]